MIIRCPQCSAQYRYDEARFGGAPRARVKCPKCGRVFEVTNPAHDAGDRFEVPEDHKAARAIAEERKADQRAKEEEERRRIEEQLRQRYFELSRELHPDLHPDDDPDQQEERQNEGELRHERARGDRHAVTGPQRPEPSSGSWSGS